MTDEIRMDLEDAIWACEMMARQIREDRAAWEANHDPDDPPPFASCSEDDAVEWDLSAARLQKWMCDQRNQEGGWY